MTQPRAYKTRGIVLRARNLGEADKIVTLFTTEYGKVDAVAKGVRRTKSHLAGRLEFAGEALLTMHRGRNLDVIVSADLSRANWTGIVEPEAFAATNVIIEIVDTLCEREMPLPEVYDLLSNAISAIAAAEKPLTLLPRFELRLLSVLGLAPPTDTCVRCGKKLTICHPEERSVSKDALAWLDVESGGIAGSECRERWRNALELDAEDLVNFTALAAPRGEGAALLARPRVAEAIDLLVSHHLGRKPRADAHMAEFVR